MGSDNNLSSPLDDTASDMNVNIEPPPQLTLPMTHETLVSRIEILLVDLKMLEDKWIDILEKHFKKPQSLNVSRLKLFSNEQ